MLVQMIMLTMVLFLPTPQEVKDTYIKPEYQDYVEEIAESYDLNPNLILAMIESESSGRAKVESSSGCVGLMQIYPKWHQGRMERLGVTDLKDAYSNILVGCDFVAELYEKYGDHYAVLMAYNEGEYGGAIKRAKEGKYSMYSKKIMARAEELEVIRSE